MARSIEETASVTWSLPSGRRVCEGFAQTRPAMAFAWRRVSSCAATCVADPPSDCENRGCRSLPRLVDANLAAGLRDRCPAASAIGADLALVATGRHLAPAPGAVPRQVNERPTAVGTQLQAHDDARRARVR